ncbi:MAG: 2OG-Fe(II) oxygenase [Alphaproteobacteria bacterium]|nr:2OG-Fe(II) oxygenase [Alphaproteobacteria bacterium]
MTRNELRPDLIFTLSGALSDAECDALIERSEALGYGFAPVTTGLGMIPIPRVRNNSRVMVDEPETADWLWSRIADLAPTVADATAVGLNERLRFYRYHPGEYFAPHYDGAWRRSRKEFSLYTVMFWLNDAFEGGETGFTGLDVPARKGDALIFLHRQRHQGRPVTAGVKYVVRSDIMYRFAG